MAPPIKILFVCLGNTCRSPAAEYYAKKWARERNMRGDFHFASAGFNGYFSTAQPETRKILGEEEGMDMTDFRSQIITKELIQEFDYIITMENYQKRDILQMLPDSPEPRQKVFTLKEIAGAGGGDVKDPYMLGFSEYKKILHEIKGLVGKFLGNIRE